LWIKSRHDGTWFPARGQGFTVRAGDELLALADMVAQALDLAAEEHGR